jgi:2-alkyl-3-oxoalkanoate reductase
LRALVTGANGFLGRHVVGALLARGGEVRALVRPQKAAGVQAWTAPVEIYGADLTVSPGLEEAFEGVDVLVHLAALVSGSKEEQTQQTVAGTERLLEAMSKSNCRRLVLCSSFSVYDYASIRRTLDEASPLHKEENIAMRDGYTVSKWRQEKVARTQAAKHGWDLTVLRPGFIWGRDHGNFAALGHRFGPLHAVFAPLSRIPMTHVENCADVFALAATDPRAKGQTLNVADGPGERIWNHLSAHMRGSGQRALRIPVPYGLALWTARFARLTVFRRAAKVPGLLQPEAIQARFKPLHFENAKLRETLGWTPPLSYEQCLARTYGP